MSRNFNLSKALSITEKTSSIISALSSVKNITPVVTFKKKLVLKVKKTHKILTNLKVKRVRVGFYNKLNYFSQSKSSTNNQLIRNTYDYLRLTKRPLQTRLLGWKGLSGKSTVSLKFF